MNRRTLLCAGSTLSLVGLAGCLGSIGDLRLSTPVTLTIENETDSNHSVVIVAHSLENNRQTYDEAVTAPPGQSTSVGHLSDEEQHLRIELVEETGSEPGDGEVLASEETFVGEDTQSVAAYISEEGLRLELEEREDI